jgi:Tfp pilus assembly protein PilV
MGFTIIEVLLALAILGFGLLTIATLQVNNTNFNSGSRQQTEGYTWAMDQVENLLHGGYDTDADLQVQGSAAVVGDGHMITQGPYTVEWDVIDNSANIANTRLVSVSIRHNNREVAQVNYTRVRESF